MQYKLRLTMNYKLPNILFDLLIIKLPLILFFVLTTCTNKNPVLININDETIALESFKGNYSIFLKHTLRKDNLKNRYMQANSLIDEKLITDYALSDSKNYENSINPKLEKIKKQLLLNEYYETMIKQNIKTDDDLLRKIFLWSKTTILVRHLFAKSNNDIQKIKLRLESGELWEKIADETFQDKNLKANGGYLGMINIGEMDPAFEVAAFALKDGEISEPVRTSYGYSIIQVLGREYNPIITEDNFQHELAFLQNHALSLLSYPALDRHTKKLIRGLNINFNDKILKQLWDYIELGQKERRLNQPAQTLVTFGNKRQWSIQQCLSKIETLSIRQKNNINSEKRLELTIKGLIIRMHLLQRAIELGLNETDNFKKEINQVKTHFLIQSVLSDKLSSLKNIKLNRQKYFNFISDLKIKSTIEIDTILLKTFTMASDG